MRFRSLHCQHAVYCLRQAALIHIERQWEENRFTAEGRVLHDVAHDPVDRKRGGIRRVMALPLACRRLNLTGVADLVEFRVGASGRLLHGGVDRNRACSTKGAAARSRLLHGGVDRNRSAQLSTVGSLVASFTGAWIETSSRPSFRRAARRRLLHGLIV